MRIPRHQRKRLDRDIAKVSSAWESLTSEQKLDLMQIAPDLYFATAWLAADWWVTTEEYDKEQRALRWRYNK